MTNSSTTRLSTTKLNQLNINSTVANSNVGNTTEIKYSNSVIGNLIRFPNQFNQTKFALSDQPVMDSIVSNSLGLIYPLAANTHEAPHTCGLVTHSICVEMSGNFFESQILKLFNPQQQQNIQANLPNIRWIRQIYAGLHDIGKAYKAYQNRDITFDKTKFEPKNKELELIAAQIIIFKNMFGQDLAVTKKLDKFVANNPTCVIGKQYTPEEKSDEYQAVLKEFDKLHKECKQEIDTKFKQLELQNPQDVKLFKLINILLEDTVGGYVVKYVTSKNDDDKKSVINELKEALEQQYKDAKIVYPNITKEQLVYLRLSNFLSDISYYVNLCVMYFGNDKNTLGEFDKFLKLIVHETDLSMIEELPNIPETIYTQDKNSEKKVLERPAKPDFWKAKTDGGNFWSTSVEYVKSMLCSLSYFADVTSLDNQLDILFKEAKSKKFDTAYQGDKKLSDLFISYSKSFNKSLHNEDTKIIMSHMVSKDLFSNLAHSYA